MKQQSWPNRGQYAEVIISPEIFLSELKLRKASISKNSTGLPLVWSGQFAIVFKFIGSNQKWAVRCFTSKVSDQQERYTALNNSFHNQGKPSCFVDFNYYDKGILVSGFWYPLICMEWAEGQTLDKVIEERIDAMDTKSLRKMAETFRETIQELANNHIAHGDLQHENILFHNGQLRLVDYDSTYVPALRGRKSLEIGLNHYQHPKRDLNNFDEKLDSFSSLVIYLSLRALALNPDLWRRFHNDKNLIFTEADFKMMKSPLLQELKQSSDPEIRRLALSLEKACQGSITQVPTLEEALNHQVHHRDQTTPAPSWIKQVMSVLQPHITRKTRKLQEPAPSWLESTRPIPKISSHNRSSLKKRSDTDQKPSWMKDIDHNKGK